MTDQTSDLIILTGPPGAGKSTVAQVLASTRQPGVHLHTDDFWHYIVSGMIPPYLPDAAAQNDTVLDVVARASYTYAAGGFFTVTDGIIGPWMLEHFRQAFAPSVRTHYVVLRPSRETTLQRAQCRTAPDALTDAGPVLHMWDQFSELGDYERFAVDSGSQTTEETVRAVADLVERAANMLPR